MSSLSAAPASTAKTILVVDDQDFFLTAVKGTLEAEGYAVLAASDGAAALNLVDKTTIHAVISDIRMPGMTGIGLMKSIKAKHSIPVILITGFSEIYDLKQALDLGADAFLEKPFKRDDLLTTLKDTLAKTPFTTDSSRGSVGSVNEIGPDEVAEDRFAAIPIREFVSGSKIQYPIYIKLGERKFIKVAHNTEELQGDFLKRLHEKSVKHLYLTMEDFRNYVGFNLKLSSIATRSNKITREKKTALLANTAIIIAERLNLEGLNAASYEDAKEVVSSTINFLATNDATLNLLDILSKHTDHLYAHSVGVSMYAAMLARQIGWTSYGAISKVSIAGLFHDIGKKEIDVDILNRPRLALSANEIKVYETHSMRGAEILSALGNIGEEIIQATLQHHENNDGTGYPRYLSSGKISPLAKLIRVVDEFCETAIKNPNSPGMKPIEAITRVQTLKDKSLDTNLLLSLSGLFKAA